MSFIKDNLCGVCCLFYPAHVYNVSLGECVYCAGKSPARPVCSFCKKPFSRENRAVHVKLARGKVIAHYNCIPGK